jgi:hypothetical protein
MLTGNTSSGAVSPILSENTYPYTYTPSTSTYAGTITLSAVTSLGQYLSGAAGQFAGTLTFSFIPNPSNTAVLSAGQFGILLSIPSYIGPVNHYGYLASGTCTLSAAYATIQFNAGNYIYTLINLSANGTNITYDSTAINQIDNPQVVTGIIDSGTSPLGLSAFNVFYRTQGRQLRLVQSCGI